MNGDNGWIKIHRDIWNNPWMYKPNVLTVWVYILCHVNYQPTDVIFEGKRVTLQPGQGLFKFTEVAELLRISVATLHRITEVLKNENQIEKQSSPRNTVVTVVNWHKYQTIEKQNEKQLKNNWKTNEKQTENLPITKRNKEREEGKNIYGAFKNVRLSDEDLGKLKTEFPDWEDRIERLSEYMASTGKTYRDHLATIRTWARKDRERNANVPVRKNDAASGYARMMEILGGAGND